MYVWGGKSGSDTLFNELLIYNTNTDTWTQQITLPYAVASTVPSARYDHFVTYSSGFMFIMGGYNGSDYLSDIWRYSTQTGRWAQLSETLPQPRGSGVVLLNPSVDPEVVYLWGGSPSTNSLIRLRYQPEDFSSIFITSPSTTVVNEPSTTQEQQQQSTQQEQSSTIQENSSPTQASSTYVTPTKATQTAAQQTKSEAFLPTGPIDTQYIGISDKSDPTNNSSSGRSTSLAKQAWFWVVISIGLLTIISGSALVTLFLLRRSRVKKEAMAAAAIPTVPARAHPISA
jgi:hypothetical protein